MRARAKIADLGAPFIRPGARVLTHGNSRVVLALLRRAVAQVLDFAARFSEDFFSTFCGEVLWLAATSGSPVAARAPVELERLYSQGCGGVGSFASCILVTPALPIGYRAPHGGDCHFQLAITTAMYWICLGFRLASFHDPSSFSARRASNSALW